MWRYPQQKHVKCTYWLWLSASIQIPIVDDEIKKAAGNVKEEDIQMVQGSQQKLVTADGTYASQSAFNTTLTVKKEINRWVLNIMV